LAWLLSTVTGVVLAGQIADHRALGLDFAFAAAFIALSRSVYRSRSDLLPWAVAVAVVIGATLSGVIDASFGLITGGLAGAAAAAVLGSDADHE
ncbi:MAG: AzlC family protein, partial [Pseudomonadota bacterium]